MAIQARCSAPPGPLVAHTALMLLVLNAENDILCDAVSFVVAELFISHGPDN